jgi:hypothetical protein
MGLHPDNDDGMADAARINTAGVFMREVVEA